ncbi:uncharacterized protein LOC130429353 isoform X1 [Triplophysa dalaica]|uniref:uncharacterized protein LOC130429353 isoform X1 n=1 Tax=Triplophysa dalaica TaxID=1582913 RepID=UPI0024DF96CB|nr:uncharacterized protein LOC130429353 isoform X1 [Triplophysa dalaica]
MSRWRKKKDHRFINEFLETTRALAKCCSLQVPIISQREYPHIPDDSLFLQRAAEVWGPHENIKNVSSNDDVFVKAHESVESLFDQEISSDDIFVTARESLESLFDQDVSPDDIFVAARESLESLFDQDVSPDDIFVTARESLESLFDQDVSPDDIFVAAHQNIESLKNESGSIDEVFATEKISREPNRQCAVEWPGCYIRPPVYINLDPPRMISRSTQTSECQLHISEEPKKKRRRKAIKAFFKKKWKALKRTFTRCPGDSDS